MYYLCVCVCALARVREREKLGKGVAIVAMQGSMINMSDQKCFASKDDFFSQGNHGKNHNGPHHWFLN